MLGNIENFQIAKDLQIESCSFQWSLELPNNAPNSRIFMPSSLGQIINDNCVVDHSKQTIEISPGNYSLHEFAVHVQANALKRLNSDLLHISARGLCGNESMIPGGSAIILEASNNIDNQQDILYTVDVLCSIAPTLQVQFLNIKKVGNYVDVVHSYSISDIISF